MTTTKQIILWVGLLLLVRITLSDVSAIVQEVYNPERWGMFLQPPSNVSYYARHEMNDAIQGAKYHLHRQSINDTGSRLSIMIAFSFSLILPLTKANNRRLHYLHCSLGKLYQNIGSYTPIDVYLWISNDPLSTIPAWIHEEYPQAILLPIPPSSWKSPPDLAPHSEWKHASAFSEDYYLHSRWRLTFAMDFVKALGYRYVLLVDDDTFVTNPIMIDIVQEFTRFGIVMGNRERTIIEKTEYITGLPEFTRYWMSIRQMNHPIGTLYQHLSPPNIQGLTTNGWDRETYTGCFSILNLDFWYTEMVQNFLHHVLRLGADIDQRWTEQAIQNMIRLLFVPPELTFNIPASYMILHGQPKIHNLPHISCPRTRDRLLLPYVMNEEENHEDEALVFGEYRIHKLMIIVGAYPLEIADFDWTCAKYGTAMKISCQERPYASLPFYIEAFCRRFIVTDAYCAHIRNTFANELQLPESALVINETEYADKKVFYH